MIRVNYHLAIKELEALRLLSKNTGVSVAEHIRRAIDQYLRKEKKK